MTRSSLKSRRTKKRVENLIRKQKNRSSVVYDLGVNKPKYRQSTNKYQTKKTKFANKHNLDICDDIDELKTDEKNSVPYLMKNFNHFRKD